MTDLIKHYLPSPRAALHASWITVTVLFLLLGCVLFIALARFKSVDEYWQSIVLTSLALLVAQWLTTATWIQALTHRTPWTGRTFVTMLAWMSAATILYAYALTQMMDPIIPALEVLTHQPSPGLAEGTAFIALCAGAGLCLVCLTLVMAYLGYLGIRQRHAIG